MRQPAPHNFLVLLVVVSLFATTVLHMLFMTDAMAASQNCVTGMTQSQNCHQPVGVTCCTTESSVLHNLLQATPQQFAKIIVSPAAAASFTPLLLLVLLYENSIFVVFRRWFRKVRLRIVAFRRHLGFWLRLLAKRDPASLLWWRGFVCV